MCCVCCVACGKMGGKAHPKYPDSFKLVVAGSLDENDWRTRSSMGRESHAFLSSMNPSVCLSRGSMVSNMDKLVEEMRGGVKKGLWFLHSTINKSLL